MAEPSDASWRMLQPSRFRGRAVVAHEFIAAVGALAAQDGSAGWQCAMFNAAAYAVAGLPDDVGDQIWSTDATALVSAGHRPRGRLVGSSGGRRLTGRWPAVTGAELADWLLLSADDDGTVCSVLVPRHEARVEPAQVPTGLSAAGICAVSVSELPVADQQIWPAEFEPSGRIAVGVLTGAGAAAAVVGSADGLWRAHVGQVRERLAASYGSDEAADQMASAAQVARAASDIDAARLQITNALDNTLPDALWAQRQAVSRARAAADHLLGSSRRHALDASDPVTRFWQDVHTGCRLTVSLLDGLGGF